MIKLKTNKDLTKTPMKEIKKKLEIILQTQFYI